MSKPSSSHDFYLGALFVSMQSLLGFWRYRPASTGAFYIAVIASVAIPIGFGMKQAWARGAAMLVAAFGIFGELSRFGRRGGAFTTCVVIACYALVFIWLRRNTVQEHFTQAAQRKRTGEPA